MYSEMDVMDGLVEAYLSNDEIISRTNNAGIEQVVVRNHDGRVYLFSVQEVSIAADGSLQA